MSNASVVVAGRRPGLGVVSMSSVDLFGFCELQFDCELAKKFQAFRGPQKGR
jgi:hypothetical protein